MTLSTRSNRKTTKTKAKAPRKLSRLVKPADMSVEDWQVALRQSFAREQRFKFHNLGDDPVFSEFSVTNPESRRTYHVTVRGLQPGMNSCTCPDFALNTLGTCKHIEFTLERLRRRKGARKLLRQGFRPAFSEISLRCSSRREVTLTLGTEACPKLIEVSQRYFDANGTLRDGAAGSLPDLLTTAEAEGWDLRCSDAALDFLAQLRDADFRRQHLEHKYAGQEQPPLLKTTLYPYQWEGALFAATAGRALLGDEMGLGKTVQALAYVELMVREFNADQVLIICPASLKYQWKQEIEKFTDRTVTIVEGALHQRRERYQESSFFKIVNYDVVHRDLEEIARMAPDLVILDEAQRIKNWRTRAARAVKSVTSPYALVLTGTPLENRLEELHSIVSFVDQYRLGPLFRLLDNHQETEPESTKVIGYRNLASISDTLRPVMLRRRKQDVSLQLPERVDRTYFVPMERQQAAIHTENREIVAMLVAKWRRHKFLTESDQRRLQVALLRMRMVCDNTFLVDHKSVHGKKVDELMLVLEEVLDDPDAKVVIFSEWTRMHDLVVAALEARDLGYVYLNGSVAARQRGDLVARFKDDPDVRVFLSTDAGNAGLNLQTASVVVNLDLPWNPAKLEQRVGRVHRIGQKRMVQVVNFVAQGSIEHGMLSVLQFKRSLFEGVLDGGPENVTLEGSRLELFMQTVEAASSAMPAAGEADPAEESSVPEEVSAGAEPGIPSPSPMQPQESMPSGPSLSQWDTDPGHPGPADRPGQVSDGRAGEGSERQSAPVSRLPQSGSTPSPERSGEAATARGTLTPLLQAGLTFVQELGHLLQSSQADGESPLAALVERDEASGRTFLRVPVPEPDVVDNLVAAVGSLLGMLQAKR